MDYGLVLAKMHPEIDKSQYEITQTVDGTIQITRWDPTDVPKPTDADITNYWNTQMMDYFRAQKKASLDALCDAAIMGGFVSSALGTAHTYPSYFQAEVWWTATLHRFANDPTYTTTSQKTIDSGYLPHTKAQFIQAFNDGHAFGEAQIAHLNDLKSKVDTAQTQADLDAISW